MQEEILTFLNKFNIPVISFLLRFFSFFSGSLFSVLLFLVLIWSIDKKKSDLLFYIVLLNSTITQTLKFLTHMERPFVKLKNLKTFYIQSAQGYSFPSGHTSNAVALWYTLYKFYPYDLWKYISILMITLCALSRMVFLLHWPLDVFCGLIIGFFSFYVFPKSFDRLCERVRNSLVLTLVFSVLFLSGAIVFLCLFFSLSSKEIFSIIEISSGISGYILGRYLDNRLLDYKIQARLAKHIVRILFGYLTTFLVGLIFELIPVANHVIVPFFCSVWVVFLYPFVGYYLHLFDAKKLKRK